MSALQQSIALDLFDFFFFVNEHFSTSSCNRYNFFSDFYFFFQSFDYYNYFFRAYNYIYTFVY